MTGKSDKHFYATYGTLDSCFDLIRSHHQYIPWSPPVLIEPATTAETPPLGHRSTSHSSDAKSTSQYVAEEFWFGAQFNSTHNFTQSGWPILFNPDLFPGQQKLGKLPNTRLLAEQRRPVQTSHWRLFNSSNSMDTWGNLSNLIFEYELDTFNTPHTGITLCHPQNWLCRCDA